MALFRYKSKAWTASETSRCEEMALSNNALCAYSGGMSRAITLGQLAFAL